MQNGVPIQRGSPFRGRGEYPPPPAGGHCSGRYTSYWDAFFFSGQFLLSASALYHGLIRFADCKNTPSLGFTPHFQIVNINKIHDIKINDKRTLYATFTKFKQILPHSHVKEIRHSLVT